MCVLESRDRFERGAVRRRKPINQPPPTHYQVVLEAPDAASLTSLAAALTDAGANVKLWVEQPENVPTALAAGPAPKSTLAPLLKKLPLCRAVVTKKK